MPANNSLAAALVAAALFVVVVVSGAPAVAQSTSAPAVQKPARPAAPAAVPADVRARVVAKLPGAKASDVSATLVPGLYEVTVGSNVLYVSADGRYLLSGNLYDLATEQNLTEARRSGLRARALASAREDQMIVFSPPNPKMSVSVFTDIDCGFCRRFHSQMAEFNKAGIRVRYLLFPRTGPGTDSWRKAEAVICSADRKDALTRAKRGEDVKAKDCGNRAVEATYALGEDVGVNGTPAVFADNGEYLGGYMTADQLTTAIRSAQAGVAAR